MGIFLVAFLSAKRSCTAGREIYALMLAFRQLIACSTIFRNSEYGGNIRRFDDDDDNNI